MREVDKRRDDEQANEAEINKRDRPRKHQPNGEKKQRRQQLDREVTEGDSAPALCAFPAQPEPAHERQILRPRDLFFAGGTEGALRLVDRQIEREPIDADV